MNTRIVINADDYGLTDGVCDAIDELVAKGAVSNTTMMLCAEGAPDRINKRGSRATLEVAGVHLQLTSGRPIARTETVPSLVDGVGRFKDPRKYAVDPRDAEKEWRAQIELAKMLIGRNPTHLDSHHGMHRIPELFKVYVRLALEYELPFRGANNELREEITSRSLPGTTALVRDWTGSCTGPHALIDKVRKLTDASGGPKIIEVITHPGIPDARLNQVSSLNTARRCDYESLMELREKDLLSANRLQMVNFKDLYKYV